MPGEDLEPVRPPPPLDAAVNDPSRRTLREIQHRGGRTYARIYGFPDGSVLEDLFFEAEGGSASAPAGADGKSASPEEVARRLAEAERDTLLYDEAATSWFAWDGALWRRCGVTRQVRAALRAAGVDDPWPGLVAAVELLARTEPALRAAPAASRPDLSPADIWDLDPWLLGTPGGTVDLRTGVLRPADPADRITRSTAVVPDARGEGADCPRWRRFLDQATGDDPALVTFLQRFCGYALTGETCEHALFFGLGEGGNGKSVFVNTVRAILGSYAAVAAPDLLTQGAERRAKPAHSAEIATLAGARLVTASETEEGRTWADGRLKLLTGGDPITARFCGRDPFTFTPRFKLMVVGNHMPVLRSVDAALRRRLCIVPFAGRPAVPDRWLEARLRAEAPAILRWMIEGCLAWAQDGAGGLMRPAAVAAATDTYLDTQDLVGQFLAECCERGDTCLETSGDLYRAWRAYARTLGEAPGTQRRFAARLERHGLTRQRLHHARVYRGARLVRPGELMGEVWEARKAEMR